MSQPFSMPRHEIIAKTPALHEREIVKMAALSDALATALKQRSVRDLPAVLAAQSGMAAFSHATVSWLQEPEPDLRHRLNQARRALTTLHDRSE